MADSKRGRHAVFLLRNAGRDYVTDAGQRRWLSRGEVKETAQGAEPLNRVLGAIGHAPHSGGLAALRFWGQTGERSATWIAGADPVHLETMLADLRLHAFADGDIDGTECGRLFDDLQQALGDENRLAFARIGSCGYLRGGEALSTADVSALTADGTSITALMPGNDTSGRYHRILGEIQMTLHDHDLNRQRAAAGKLAINSLWFWGGGVAPEKDVRPIPLLFSADPLFHGYWKSCTGVVEDWHGSLARCLDVASQDFVVTVDTPAGKSLQRQLATLLDSLHAALRSGQIQKVTLQFGDGMDVCIRRENLLRIWRGIAPQFRGDDPHE